MNAHRRPLAILELRSVRGTGGGPEKTILRGAAHADAGRFTVTVCYIRDLRDRVFEPGEAAGRLGVDYVEIPERHSFDPRVWPELRRLVRDRHIAIVHAHDYKTDLLAHLLARVERVVPMSTVHGWSGYGARERLLYYPADRRILRRFAHVIAVSGPIRDRLIQSGVPGARVSMIPNGIDPEAFRRQAGREAAVRARLNLPPAAVLVGAVGRLEVEKRYDVLIEAVAILRETRPELKLLLAGTGSQEGALRDLARRRGIADACLFLGHRSDVPDILQAIDCFVQSSDTEGTPNAVLEAMALETPVVATDVGGTSDLIRENTEGLLVPRRDPAALAAAVADTLGNRNRTAGRVAAARRRIEQELSFDRRMEAVERLYETLAAEGEAAAARAKVNTWILAREKR